MTCQYRQPKSGNAVLGEKSLVLERIWGHLALQLAEGTFENVEERPRFGWRRCGLVCNRKCTSWTVEPVLLLMPTLSDPSDGGWGTLNGFSQHSVCEYSPLNEDWLLHRGIQLEHSRLGILCVLAANDNSSVCLSPWEGC